MKINNGMWLIAENLDVKYPREVYDFEVKNNRLILYMPFVKVLNRGNTLDGGMLTLEIGIYESNISFKAIHNKTMNKSKYAIKREFNSGTLTESDSDSRIKYTCNGICLQIDKNTCVIEVYYNDELRTTIPAKGLAYIVDQDKQKYMMGALELGVNEKTYGLGERFTEFIKNGQSVDIWNQDGGTDSEQTYKNIPFLLSTNKYGLYVDHSEKVNFEIGSNLVSQNQFIVKNQELRFDLILADNLLDVIGKYGKLTGQVPKLPEWSYGLWLSTSFTTNYSEQTVLEFIDGMIERDIPFEVFHFDCFWMKEFEWTNFEWNTELFPDPEGLLKKIHARGKKVCVWINPYIAQKSSIFDEAYENGYLIMGENKQPWQIDLWQPSLAIVDFTNPAAVKWYQNKLRNLMAMGVDTFKTDFGERIPVPSAFYQTSEVNYYDNSDPFEMHNYYTHLYNKAVFEVIKDFGKEPCLFARSGTVGGQQYPVHWGGDCLSNYVSQAESLRGGLSLSISGYAYWSHDIGGFEAGCNPDIYKRWTQFGLLSSHSRYHGNEEYKVPWLYGEEAVDVARKFVKLKNRLMPYFYELQNEAVNHGYPMMRAMVTEFLEDFNTRTLDMQYMLGSKLLVAPIFNKSGNCDYYLPKGGRWLNILTEKIYEGNSYYHEKFDYFTLPVMLRENTVLILKNDDSQTSFDCRDGITIYAFNLEEDKQETIIVNGEEVVVTITQNDVLINENIKYSIKRF